MMHCNIFISILCHSSSEGITVLWKVRPGYLDSFLHLSSHIIGRAHSRCLWWPVTAFNIGLYQQSFLSPVRIMNGGVVLLELDYSVAIKQSDIWHHYSLQNVLILKTI